MATIFPEPVTQLPEADMPIEGISAYISQGENHQILFMRFEKDAEFPEHAHESQWGIVLEGKIEITIDGIPHTFGKGDRYFVEKGVKHSSKVFAGYADMTFFNQKDRYKAKK